MDQHSPFTGSPHGLFCKDIIIFPDAESQPMHDPGVSGYDGDAKGYNNVMDASTKDRGDDKGKQYHWKAHEGIHGPHDKHVDDPPKVSGDNSQGDADGGGDSNGDKADHQRRPRAVDKPAQRISAEEIGAQGMLPRWCEQAAGNARPIWVIWCQLMGKKGCKQQCQQHDKPEDDHPSGKKYPSEPLPFADAGRGFGKIGVRGLLFYQNLYPLSVSYPGIKPTVGYIDNQIDHENDDGNDESDGLNDDIVLAKDATDKQPADTGNGKNRLNQYGSCRAGSACMCAA